MYLFKHQYNLNLQLRHRQAVLSLETISDATMLIVALLRYHERRKKKHRVVDNSRLERGAMLRSAEQRDVV